MAVGCHAPLIRHRNFEGIRRQTKPLIVGHSLSQAVCTHWMPAWLGIQARTAHWRVWWHQSPGDVGNMMDSHLSTVLVSFIQIS